MDLFILFFYFFCIDPHGCIKKIKNKKFVIENLFKKKNKFYDSIFYDSEFI